MAPTSRVSARGLRPDPVCGMTVPADAGPGRWSTTARPTTSAARAAGAPSKEPGESDHRQRLRGRPAGRQGLAVLRRHPPGRRLPAGRGADRGPGDGKYRGRVAIRMGPVKLQFAGTAEITERDDAAKRIAVDAAGADEKGRGQAAMVVTAVRHGQAAARRSTSPRTSSCPARRRSTGAGMIVRLSARCSCATSRPTCRTASRASTR